MELVNTFGANCYATAMLFDIPDDFSDACNSSDARHGFRICVRNKLLGELKLATVSYANSTIRRAMRKVSIIKM